MSNVPPDALVHKIAAAVNETGRCNVTLPAELAVLHQLGDAGIHEFAGRHGWTAIIHLGGEPIEFFKTVQTGEPV